MQNGSILSTAAISSTHTTLHNIFFLKRAINYLLLIFKIIRSTIASKALYTVPLMTTTIR